MKVAFVIDDSLDNENFGVQQYVLLLGKFLHDRGHKVFYLSGQTRRKDLENLYSLSKNISVSFNKNRLSIPLNADKYRIKEILEREKFDVVHIQMPYSPLLSGKIIKLLPETTALIGTFHIVGYSATQTLAAKALAKSQSRTLARFDRILAVSTAAADFAKKIYVVESVLLPNVVDFSKVKKRFKKPNSKTKTVVFVGRLVARKGVLYLLKAVKKLNERGYEIRVIICGSGPEERKLQAFKRKHNLKNVSFLGLVSEAEKYQQLSSADIAAFPSTGGESFGIVLIEAMAAGAGVVMGGNNIGYKTVLGQWPKTLFDPKNSVKFSDSLAVLLTDTPLKQKIHSEQQQAVKNYQVERVGQKLLKHYEEIINKKAELARRQL